MQEPGIELSDVSGVGPVLMQKLAHAGIASVDDLLRFYPRKYNDFSAVHTVATIKPGTVTLKGTLASLNARYVRRGMHVTEGVFSDDTGSVRVVWFNQAYRAKQIKPHTTYYLSGLFELRRGRFSITNPSLELVSDFQLNTARIVPVYREIKGLKSTELRKVIHNATQKVKAYEPLPAWLVEQFGLVSHFDALTAIHFPNTQTDIDKARFRLGFEEVFELVLAAKLTKQKQHKLVAPRIPFNTILAQQAVASLPFSLTDDQRKVLWQIYTDLQKTHGMNRLVEGDVGSGKTVVAALAALMVADAGFQTALMAPTELLAKQHAHTIYIMLQGTGYEHLVGLVVGSMKQAERKRIEARITAGDVNIIIGTHALIQSSINMHSLGLVVIDEQHRFGVEQRNTLQKKAGHMPHVLSMTATPIPRSLALTLYGELDISLIRTKPANRLPIITKIASPNSRPALYGTLEHELENGRQMYVVCPTIEDGTDDKIISAESHYKTLKKQFKKFRVGLVHGKMKAEDKQQTMQAFKDHELDILVATTVIEVGVDVPNATVMLIEHADRFGLAQLHQLRGRVGRGEHQGYCYLMMTDSKAPSARMRAIESTNDGFKLSEYDLELRGPGAIYGTRQHGTLDLRIAQLTDTHLIEQAQQAAEAFLRRDNLLHYKQLSKRIAQLQTVTRLD